MYIKAMLIAITMALFGAGVPAQASDCSPSSREALIQAILAKGNFNGKWELVKGGKKYSGPLDLKFYRKSDGTVGLKGLPSDEHGKRPGWYEYKPRFSRNKVTFQTNSHGTVNLKWENCELIGTQARPRGTLLHLQ